MPVPHTKRELMSISRRNAIKGISAGMATAVVAPILSADTFPAKDEAIKADSQSDRLNVQIAHQWGNESIVAVIRNTSDHNTTITDISPVTAGYGRFDFSDLTKTGPVTLAAGEEVHVPFTVMGTPAKPFGHFDNRLQKMLKKSLAVTTTNSNVKVTTSMSPRIV